MCNKENILQGNCNTVITLTIKVFMTSIIKLIMWKFIFYLIYTFFVNVKSLQSLYVSLSLIFGINRRKNDQKYIYLIFHRDLNYLDIIMIYGCSGSKGSILSLIHSMDAPL